MRSLFSVSAYIQALRELAALLSKHRNLTLGMAKRELVEQYAGQVFGAMWAFGHPLVLIGVYVFLFGVVFKTRIGGTRQMPLNFAAYIMVGLIPWLTFQTSMSKACFTVISHANLVKQVIFPVEVLPIKMVVATMFTHMVLLTMVMSYIILSQRVLYWTFLLLPVVLLFQTLAMIGVSFTLAAIGVYFRDVKDFVQIFSYIGVYMMPVFYLPDTVPDLFKVVLYSNPFSYLIWCYQDILYFGRIEHPWAWPIWTILSLLMFTLGYRFFRKLKVLFGNVL